MKKTIILFIFASLFLTSCDQVSQKTEVFEGLEKPVETAFHYPIDNFETGITLKHFGTFITPETSPIQPERFRGYHTGVDVEVAQNLDDVWVYAIADGEVVAVRNVDGYGGVIQIVYGTGNDRYTALYGHVNIGSSLVSKGDKVVAGDTLAVLGKPYSSETDNERKHLHFSLKSGLDYDLKGYVQNEENLEGWIDPESFAKRKWM